MSSNSSRTRRDAATATATTLRLEGEVVRVHFESPGFTAGRLRLLSGDDKDKIVSFAGAAHAKEGEVVVLAGRWETHPTYGKQFKTADRALNVDMSREALAAWLAKAGLPGLGPRRAEAVAARFADDPADFGRALESDPEMIARECRVPLGSVQNLAESWRGRQGLHAVGTHLAPYGVTYNQALALYEEFGGSTISLLQSDPYLLIRKVDGFGFKRVDEVARKMGTHPDHPGRIRAAARHVLIEAEQNDGTTCLTLPDLLAGMDELLGTGAVPQREMVRVARDIGHSGDGAAPLSFLTLSGVSSTPLTLVARARLYAFESGAYERVRRKGCASAADSNPHFSCLSDGELDALIARSVPPGSALDASQFAAVRLALRSRHCLIAGGAGTGKTYIARTIYRAYRARGLGVALCAPTGKAARRLGESIPQEDNDGVLDVDDDIIDLGGDRPPFVVSRRPQTVHKLLGWRPPNEFVVGGQRKLSSGLLMIDEASMLDAELTYRVCDAAGEDTCLVFIGDQHQLPPVGPGAFLRDALDCEIMPAAVLTQCHRQAGHLRQSCAAILGGDMLPSEPSGAWSVFTKLREPKDVLACIERIFTRELAGRLGCADVLRDAQFLSPIHGGPLGTTAVNLMLQRLHQRALTGEEMPEADPEKSPPLYPGDKVIQTKNNYDLGIMNGQQGVVVRAPAKGLPVGVRMPLIVRFEPDNVEVTVPHDRAGEVRLAYCLSVHKCQGSQWPVVVTICHRTHKWMLSRQWLYTAVTRARRASVVLGDDQGVSYAIRHRADDKRRTLLPFLHAGAVLLDHPDSSSSSSQRPSPPISAGDD